MNRRLLTPILVACTFILAASGAIAQTKYDTTGSGDFGNGGVEPGAKDTWAPGAGPSFWNKDAAPVNPSELETNNPLSEFNNINMPAEMRSQEFTPPGTRQQYGDAFKNPYGGVSITKGTSQVDLSIMGSGFNTGFKIEKPTEYTQIMKRAGMPSTFNEQGGVDDPLNGF